MLQYLLVMAQTLPVKSLALLLVKMIQMQSMLHN